MRGLNARKLLPAMLGAAAAIFVVGLVHGVLAADPAPDRERGASAAGIEKIEHVIVIVQQNRSFDNYFGTFPGARGIPMKNGIPTVCLPNPAGGEGAAGGECVRPARDSSNHNVGGLHGYSAAIGDINGGRMNGFLGQVNDPAKCRKRPGLSACAPGTGASDAIGYHDSHEIPNYWAYARNFVLQDRMFAASLSWGGPTGMLYMVSGWSARCSLPGNPMSCKGAVETNPAAPAEGSPGAASRALYPWTDITFMLRRAGVSWAHYEFTGTRADCSERSEDFLLSCRPGRARAQTPARWGPIRYFNTVRSGGQLGNIKSVGEFYEAAVEGELPAVSWVVPSIELSERAPGVVSAGESYVTGLVNAVMSGPDWESSAIFVTWDDWGGYYDHMPPPRVDGNGYGIRIPGLVISPYAKRGYIDHQTLSSDAYLKFIEDVFLQGRRLDPRTDGRPDSRPVVRERVRGLGDLRRAFDFSQEPREPMPLPLRPKRIQYSALWKGKRVRLTSTPNVNVARVADAKRIGRARSFKSNDPAFGCLQGQSLQAWSLPGEFPGRIVISHPQKAGCRAGTWVVPR